MKLIITTDKNAVTNIEMEDLAKGDVTYNNLLAISLSLMEAFTRHFMEEVRKEEHNCNFEGLYDDLNTLFDVFLRRVFPDIQPLAMDLSDAAILYAQDKIIETAEKKGISYEEAMEKFEKKAKEYIRQRREGYLS